jgi:hypothetical protein
MAEQYLTFKVFPDSETAKDFSEVLKQANIPYYIEEDVVNFDPSYANNQFNKDYRLKLRQQDFSRANEVLEEYFKKQLEQIDKDYYLFSFSDEELQDILAKPDEWGHLDYLLATELLKRRGKEVNPQQTQELRESRLIELAEPVTVKSSSIVLTYIFGFLFFPAGLFIGWNWANAKKTLSNGERVPMFTTSIQKHGIRIFIVAFGIMIVTIVGRIMVSLR